MIQLGPDPHKWPEPYKSRYAERLLKRRSLVFTSYQTKPHAYGKQVLKISLTDDQSEILTSVRDNRYTLVQASHAVGKTFIAAVCGNHWYDCWPEHICYITAPTWPQALGLTFKELKTQRRQQSLPGTILETGIVKDLDKLREGSHYIRALNAERGEGFQGEHAAPILIIIEEGVGVPKYIWEAVKGLMTAPENRLLVIGNPTDDTGDFGQAAEDGKFNVIRVSALDHPNIIAEMECQPPPYPKAVRLIYVYEMLRDECDRVDSLTEDAFEWHSLPDIERALKGQSTTGERWFYMPNAVFQGRVLGEFPTQADQQVIPKAWLRSQPVLQPLETDAPELGVDIARFGDDRTTIFVRRGPCLLKGREIRKMDSVEVATAIEDDALEAVKEWKPALTLEQHRVLAKRIRIKIDVTGGMGTGPYDILRRKGYNVTAVNSSEKAYDQEQYRNKRSELWFDMRTRVRNKRLDLSRLRSDIRTRLEREFSTPKYKAPGQKIVEEKADMKKRLGYSPDLADGANLAFYQEKTRTRWDTSQMEVG